MAAVTIFLDRIALMPAMAPSNSDIAGAFVEIADLLSLQGADAFRIRAYREAARFIAGHTRALADLVQEGAELESLPTIGKDLAQKVYEFVQSGRVALLEELRQQTPAGLLQVMRVEGMGPKRTRVLHERLGVIDIQSLQRAAQSRKVRHLPGFGPKTEAAILARLPSSPAQDRHLRYMIRPVADALVAHLLEAGAEDVVVAGSYRRRAESVGDLNLLVADQDGTRLHDALTDFSDADQVLQSNARGSIILLRSGLRVDLHVVALENFGAALHHFTGSTAHNVGMQQQAQKQGLRLDEQGLWDRERRVAGRTEQEIFAGLGLPYIEPELREGKGELEAAAEGRLPKLVRREDVQGDLHMHTDASDGRHSLEAMAEAARRAGHDYIAVTDHSPHPSIAQGLGVERLQQRFQFIDEWNRRGRRPRILRSAEVDIGKDGSLDYPDDVLEQMDLVICSVHSSLRMDRKAMTRRVTAAMSNPYAHILAHPTGRRIGRRAPADLDMEKVLDAAAEQGWAVEVDGQPDRLDLRPRHLRMALERGVKVVLSSDAHSAAHLDFLDLAVDQARRGWVQKEDVLNTRPWEQLKRMLRHR